VADQSVKITDLPLGGSREAVALELWKLIRYKHGSRRDVEGELKLYTACLDATSGRQYDISALT
jgi:hypothetical protein